MANRTIKVFGINHAADTALTVKWGGTQVYSGTLSASVVNFDDVWGGDTTSPSELFEFTYNNADDTALSTHALEITVTAGSCSVGEIFDISNNANDNYDTYPSDGKPPVMDIGGKYYWTPGAFGVYHDGSAPNAKSDNSLINASGFSVNGAAIEKTSDQSATWNWEGCTFPLSTSDVFTVNVKVAPILVTNPNSGKAYGWTGD